jgi:DNA polymerase-3 subunit delta
MQIGLGQLSSHIARGLHSLYTLHGDEPLLQQEAAGRHSCHGAGPGLYRAHVHTVAGAHFDWSEVLAAGGSLSLFADKQIVEIRIPSGKPGKEGSVRLCSSWPKARRATIQTLLLVLCCRAWTNDQDQRLVWPLWNSGVTLQVDPWSAVPCRSGSPSDWPQQGQRVVRAKKASARCSFLPTGWRAICWQRTRRSRSWLCCFRQGGGDLCLLTRWKVP